MNFETTTPELKNYLNQIFEELKKRGENIVIAYSVAKDEPDLHEFNGLFFCRPAFTVKLAEVVTLDLEKTLEKQTQNGN